MPNEPSNGGTTGVQWFREVITAIISLAILWLSSWMLYHTFKAAEYNVTEHNAGSAAQATLDDPAEKAKRDEARKAEAEERTRAFANEKDILLYGLSLLGTVTGYFLGRVPAELHAAEAKKNAALSQDRANTALEAEARAKKEKQEMVSRTTANLDRALAVIDSAHPGTRDVSAEQAAGSLNEARTLLEQLRNSLVSD